MTEKNSPIHVILYAHHQQMAENMMYPTPESLNKTASEVFCVETLHPWQISGIQNVMKGNNTFIVNQATGSGKSMVYSLPAYLHHEKDRRFAIVISPLLALMEDQQRKLTKAGIISVLSTKYGRRVMFKCEHSGKFKATKVYHTATKALDCKVSNRCTRVFDSR